MPCLRWRSKRASPAPTSSPSSLGIYSDPKSLFELLRSPATGGLVRVRLLRCSWLLQRADKISSCTSDAERAAWSLPRRQDLESTEPEAFLSAEDVEALPRSVGDEVSAYDTAKSRHILRVLSVSHAWERADHPDPFGRTLVALAAAIRRAQSERVPTPVDGQAYHTLPSGELGVFLDWTALTQKDASGARTPGEQAAFDGALGIMQLWYAHTSLTVFLMTGAPTAEGGGLVPYMQRGWPNFERLVAMIAKPISEHHWPLIIDVGSGSGTVARVPPLTAAAFASRLEELTFTNGADRAVVSALYATTLNDVLGGVTKLAYMSLGWGDEDIRTLIPLLPMCKNATTLGPCHGRTLCPFDPPFDP